MLLLNLLCAFISCVPTQSPLQVQPLIPFYLQDTNREQIFPQSFSTLPTPSNAENEFLSDRSSYNSARSSDSLVSRNISTNRNIMYNDEINLELEVQVKSRLVPTVWTLSGGLEGRVMTTLRGRSIVAFEGVPYALPPVDALRFKDPIPIRPWSGVRIANKTAKNCLQLDYTQYFRVLGDENCLFINIYSPLLPFDGRTPKLPVIFFIHGGGYMSLSGNYFGPLYLLDRDVVLVTVNYRLGILGFLSTGDDVSPGNYGLKDQSMALKWVVDNIHYFGGDAKKITLMGQGSGGSSVGLHLISKKTSEYVYAAIAQSGSVFNHWSIVNDTFNSTRFVASRLYCPLESSLDMVNCLRQQNPNIVVGRQAEIYIVPTASRVAFGPVIEAPGPNSFLEESPETAYSKGNVKKVPLISGIVRDEGDIFAAELYVSPNAYLNVNLDWFGIAPFSFNYDSTSSDSDGISAKIMRYYFKNRPLTFWSSESTSKALGDRTFVQGVHTGLLYHSKIAETYGYFFNYRGQHTMLTFMGLNRKDWGIANMDDLQYIFNSPVLYPPVKQTDPEFIIADFMMNVWVNFAYTGVPYYLNSNHEKIYVWKPIQNNDPDGNVQVLEINKKPRMVDFPFLERLKFWNSLLLKNNDHPFINRVNKENYVT